MVVSAGQVMQGSANLAHVMEPTLQHPQVQQTPRTQLLQDLNDRAGGGWEL